MTPPNPKVLLIGGDAVDWKVIGPDVRRNGRTPRPAPGRQEKSRQSPKIAVMDTPWRIEMFGGLRAVQGERVITRFRTRQTGALLAYLASHQGRPLAREVVIEAIWPEAEAKTGRNNLSIALHSLRSQLEPPGVPAGAVLQSDRFSVGLNPATVVTDVAEFLAALQEAETARDDARRNAALRQAIDLYRGELLSGYYDEWIEWEQHRLQTLYEKAEEVLNSLAPGTPPTVTAPTLPTLKPQPANIHLPLQFTHFFGREEELGLLNRWVVENPDDPTNHLITLTGLGGTGKTRLAIEAAGRLAEAFPGGVWFVPLQDLSDPRLIPGTVLDALRLPRSPQTEPLHQVVEFLNSRTSAALLLLDNMEHLLDMDRRKTEDGAAVVRALLDRCPLLTCLVTSRQCLDLEGERELPVPPLPTPNVEPRNPVAGSVPIQNPPPEHLLEFASVQLFVDRAQSSKPDFQVTTSNAAAIAQLCDRLEGIPLALVLAARRAQVLTPKQMLSELEHRFAFLVSRRRDAIERHRTLRAAIEWSYRLLSPESRRFFAGLSVFRGGWTTEAAEAVCEEPMALDYLTQLQECSLVLAEETEFGMRFRMFETLREFGQEQLSSDEQEAARRRHWNFFLRLAEEAELHQEDPEAAVWLDRLDTEYDNLRAALALDDGTEAPLRLAEALVWFWNSQGQLVEGRRWLEANLARSTPSMTFARARVLGWLGGFANGLGDLETACTAFEESIMILREIGDTKHLAECLVHFGFALSETGRHEQAIAAREESLALWRELGDNWEIARMLNGLAHTFLTQGDFERAKALALESLGLLREMGDRSLMARVLFNLGQIGAAQGDITTAQAYYKQCLPLYREMGYAQGIRSALEGMGQIALCQGDYNTARALYDESLDVGDSDRRHGAFTFVLLGNLEHIVGNYDAARACYKQSLPLFQKHRDKGRIATILETLAALALAQGRPQQLARLLGAAESLRQSMGGPWVMDVAYTNMLKALTVNAPLQPSGPEISAAREKLGEEAFAAAWGEGRAMTLEEAVAYALDATGT